MTLFFFFCFCLSSYTEIFTVKLCKISIEIFALFFKNLIGSRSSMQSNFYGKDAHYIYKPVDNLQYYTKSNGCISLRLGTVKG